MKTYFAFLCLIISGGLASATTQTKPDPDKPTILYTNSYTEGDGGYSGGTVEDGRIFHFDANNWCNYNSASGGVGSDWWHPHMGNDDGQGGWWDSWSSNRMSSPLSGTGTKISSGCFSEDDTSWTGTIPSSGSSDWIPPVVWEHCGVQLLANYITGYPDQWMGSDFPAYSANAGVYHRTADAVVKLQTGGKGLSKRQNLFCLTATAAEVTDKFSYTYAWEDYYGWHIEGPAGTVPISAQSINVGGGLGHPGADNNLWVALPDNADLDVTPRVKKKDFYTFTVGAAKYKLKIQVNSAAFLSPDGVVASANYCVGQGLFFDAYWLPNTPPFADAVSHWSLPGTFVNEQPYSYCPAFYDEDPSLLNSIYSVEYTLGTFCWYVDKVSAGTASVAMSLSFPNGQTAFVGASGLFNVYRPTYTTPATIVSQGQVGLYQGQGIATLFKVMGLQAPTGTPMSYNVAVNSQFPGTAEFTQLMNGYATNTISPYSTAGTDELDTSDPYSSSAKHTASSGGGYFATPPLMDELGMLVRMIPV